MHRRGSAIHQITTLAAVVLVGLGSAVVEAQDQEGEESAQRVYIVAVPMEPGLDAVATRCGAAARAGLRGVEGVDWRGPDQQFLGYDDSALNLLSRAREQLEAGRQAYLQLDLEQAIQQLEGAVANFDAAAAALEDPGDLGEALLFLGASHAFNGQTRAAVQVFRRLHTQMPFIQPDPNTFNPDVVQLYERATPRDARAPSGVISIDSNPQGAIAYVDFLARGRTPINVDNLIAGEHVVRVTRPGATPFVETVQVRHGRAATSNAYLVDNPDMQGLSTALSRIPGADVTSIDESNPIGQVASLLDLAKIGVIRVSSADEGHVSLELLLFDVARGVRLVRGHGVVPTDIGELERGTRQLEEQVFQAALRPNQASDTEDIIGASQNQEEEGNQEPAQPTGPATPLWEQWWFWAAIGGAAVIILGLAVGLGVGLSNQHPPLGKDQGGQVIFTF